MGLHPQILALDLRSYLTLNGIGTTGLAFQFQQMMKGIHVWFFASLRS